LAAATFGALCSSFEFLASKRIGFVVMEAAMFLAKVTGSVVSTQKIKTMTGRKLLTVEPLRVDPQQRDRLMGTGRTFVCVDTVGAGQDEMVLIVQGSSARLTPETEKLPVDAAIIGIVDTVNVGNQTIFSAARESERA
jgi:ethanolamine utilization protein EutN